MAPPRDLADLLEGVRRGDAAAFNAVYARWSEMVYGVAFRCLGSASDAEDVLQDVFVGLPRALRRYEERGEFERWLKRVVVRTALMKRRTANRRREDELGAAELLPAATIDPTDRLAVRHAIESLPPDLRIVFMLKEVEGYTHAEIGTFLGITSGASAVRLFRAWRMLRATTVLP